MSIRSRVRNALIAAGGILSSAGIVTVVALNQPVNNLSLDCSGNHCDAILEPPKNQCSALLGTGGEPPGLGLDAGLPNVQVRVERALEAMRTNAIIENWHCEPYAVPDAGQSCWCDMRGSIIRNPDGTIDGQAPGWRDALDAAGVGSILKDGRVNLRPAEAIRSGCRAHVYSGEDPCAGATDLASSPDPQDSSQ